MVHGSCAVAPSIILSTRGRTLHQINCFQLWTQSNGRLDRLSTMESYEQQWILQRPLSRVKSSPQHPQRTYPFQHQGCGSGYHFQSRNTHNEDTETHVVTNKTSYE